MHAAQVESISLEVTMLRRPLGLAGKTHVSLVKIWNYYAISTPPQSTLMSHIIYMHKQHSQPMTDASMLLIGPSARLRGRAGESQQAALPAAEADGGCGACCATLLRRHGP